jgi:hypothetical protein
MAMNNSIIIVVNGDGGGGCAGGSSIVVINDDVDELILHERSLLMYSPSIYLVELWNTIKIN